MKPERITEGTIHVTGEVVWATGPKADALLRRLGLDPVFRDEHRVVVGQIRKDEK